MLRLICRLISGLILIVFIGCMSKNSTSKNEINQTDTFEGRKGCLLLYNLKTNTFEKELGGKTCKEQFPACSTFKVPLAVMAFDSGILKDENQILKWDGKKDFREVANKDQNAKNWLKDSIVWFSQRITPKIGKARLQKYLDDFNYGNKDLTSGITQAWLVAPSESKPALKISAYEQLDFMKKLWSNSLPVSKKSMKLVQDITYLETTPSGFKISGKTGSSFYDKEKKIHLGWFIAHLKKNNQEYIVITNISDLAPSNEPGYGGAKAKDLTKKLLKSSGL